MLESSATTVWKTIVLIGIGLMALGLTAFSIDYVWVRQFDFIEGHYDIFGAAILIGLICLLVGLIRWSTLLNKAGRTRLARFALVLPPAILVTAGFSIGTNMHGVFPLFGFSMAPVMLVGLVVAIMAAKAHG
jgi:hypothetical protein